jgi:hypothetical protein
MFAGYIPTEVNGRYELPITGQLYAYVLIIIGVNENDAPTLTINETTYNAIFDRSDWRYTLTEGADGFEQTIVATSGGVSSESLLITWRALDPT